ncbi:serine hydrolase [Mariniblastus sp.]|nr:serine hydrolase [Mariniblastus sp.]
MITISPNRPHQIKIGGLVLAGLTLVFASLATTASADITLPTVFGEGMVLQRNLPVPIWGTATPQEKVTVNFASQQHSTKADENGKWMIKLNPLSTSSKGSKLTIKGSNELILNDVLVGEVWLCSGQSNMADSFNPSKKRFIPEDILDSDLSKFRVSTQRGWETINEKSQRSISRVGFYFGYELYQKLDIPIGLVLRYNSGTPIQAWIPKMESEVIRKRLNIPADWNDDQENRNPAVQFEDKIRPIMPFAFRGVVWYQGERNAKAFTGWEYKELLPFLIQTWRETWAKSANLDVRNFPFYYVQVPTQSITPTNRSVKTSNEWPWLRDGMRRALDHSVNTGMAVFYDYGPSLHPPEKRHAGERLSLWALAKDYGKTEIVFSGPLLKNVAMSQQQATLTFDHIGSGLANAESGDQLNYFEVSGADGKYFDADAKIVDNSVVLSSPSVPNPVHVRYLFRKPIPNPKISLINLEGLPASPFMTDDRCPDRENLKEVLPLKKEIQTTAPANDREPQNGIPRLSDRFPAEQQTFQEQKKLPDLEKPYASVAPLNLHDGLDVGQLNHPQTNEAVQALIAADKAGNYQDLDSILIWQDGKLVFEMYNRRGRVDAPHYAMSVTKTLTSLTLARAIQLGIFKMTDLDKPIIDFMPEIDRTKIQTGVDSITLRNALMMKSGLRFPDPKAIFTLGKDFKRQAYFQKLFEITSPVTEASKEYKYSGVDPSMIMMLIDIKTDSNVQKFIKKEIADRLGLSYVWENQNCGIPKCGAGSSLTSRSLIKLGMAVLNGGTHDGQQLFSRAYIDQVMDPSKGAGYFYFFHNRSVGTSNPEINFFSGIGAGGQYMSIFPKLNLVAVATAHNKKSINLPLKAIVDHLLPLFSTAPDNLKTD